MIINKILKMFGLMKISRAKKIYTGLLCLYVENVLRWVKDDFEVSPAKSYVAGTILWASNSFDNAMKNDADNAEYVLEEAA